MKVPAAASLRIVVCRDEGCLQLYNRSRLFVIALGGLVPGEPPEEGVECYRFTALLGCREAGKLLLVYTVSGGAVIHYVYVEPWARRRGVATRLVAEAVEHARRRGARRVEAIVLDRNALFEAEPQAMRRVLEKNGFRHVGDDVWVLDLR